MPRDPRYDPLFEPIRIGPKTLKNRFFQVPHCIGAGSTRPGADGAHRGVKAEGGWAAVCTEAIMIHPETEHSVMDLHTIWDPGDVINLRHMVDSVHEWGALAGAELCHTGGTSGSLDTRYVCPAISAFATSHVPQTYAVEADEEDLQRVVEIYAAAAERAVDAGFDIVYVTGSAGTFPERALSKSYNRRTDRYGGSLENRARFAIEVLEALNKVAGATCAIAYRLTMDHLRGAQGLEAGDEAIGFIELVSRLDLVDLWDLNLGDLDEWAEDAGPSRFYESNHQAPWTRGAKSIAKVPVLGVGRFTDPDVMLRVVTSGQYDIIGGARPSIADPWLPRKIDEGRVEDICECIGCNVCAARFQYGVPIACTQNPTALEEYRRAWHPERFDAAAEPGSVMVVGAGPAGLECARVLGKQGYAVHLCEAAPELGGHLRDVVRLPGLAEWGRVITYRETQINQMTNVEVLRGLGQVTADDVLAFDAEKAVLATGARWADDGVSPWNLDPIPGVDASLPAVATPEQVWAGKEIGDRVVVLDGDGYFTAIGLAEMLADRGKRVVIVTAFDTVAPFTEYTLESANLRRMMLEKGIGQRIAHWVESIEVATETRVTVYNVYRDGYRRHTEARTGELPRRVGTEVEVLACDSVVLCTSRRPNDSLYRDLKARKEEWVKNGLAGAWRAGDCFAPRIITDAVFDGHRVAREIHSPNPERPRTMLRERPIWGNETYPKLGDPVL